MVSSRELAATGTSAFTRLPRIRLNKNQRYRKQAEGIPALYNLVLLLEFDQRCVSGLVIAIPGTANAAFGMVDAPAVIAKISDEGFVASGEAADSVLNNWPCAWA